MDLKRNIIDNVLECQLKLGKESMAVSFYYPDTSLCQLLLCSKDNLQEACHDFCQENKESLGQLVIREVPSEPGRYGITVPSSGVDWINDHYEASDFTKAFVVAVKEKGQTLSGMVDFFKSFADDVVVDKESDNEWAISFASDEVDPYVYHIEENVFGLEYHRFTKEAYAVL